MYLQQATKGSQRPCFTILRNTKEGLNLEHTPADCRKLKHRHFSCNPQDQRTSTTIRQRRKSLIQMPRQDLLFDHLEVSPHLATSQVSDYEQRIPTFQPYLDHP